MKFKLASMGVICFIVFMEMSHAGIRFRPVNSLTSFNSMPGTQSDLGQYEYKFIASSRGITKDGVQTSFRTYQSMNGVNVFSRTEFFRTTAEMETRFEAKAKSLSEIIERGKVKDSQGNTKGNRIVGKYSANESGITKFTIICSQGIEISYVESVSLDQILDFEEKVLKRQK